MRYVLGICRPGTRVSTQVSSGSSHLILDLVEHRWTRFQREALDESAAASVLSQSRRSVKVDWPNPSNGHTWGLLPEGWVGAMRVSDKLGIRVTPKTGLRHLSTWIAWTAHELASGDFEAPEVGQDSQLADVVADGLLRLLESRLQRGIHRDYVRTRGFGMAAKGRPLLRESLLRLASGHVSLAFEQTTLSADIEDNRLVYWALHRLALLNLLSERVTYRLHWLLGFMAASVALRPYEIRDYSSRRYSSRAVDYTAIHHLCALLLEGLGPDASVGERRFGEFTVSMWELFQRAVGVALHRGLAGKSAIDTSRTQRLGKNFVFKPDIVVVPRDGTPPVVVEVKYKDPTVGIAPDDVRQAVAYATSIGARRAMLVFPTAGAPDETLQVGPVQLEFAHLDLSLAPQNAAAAFIAQCAEQHIRAVA